MKDYQDITTCVGKVQGDGNITIDIPAFVEDNNFHQITVEPVLATVGTVALKVKAAFALEYEDLTDVALVPVVIDLALGTRTVNFPGKIQAIQVIPIGVDSTYNATYYSEKLS